MLSDYPFRWQDGIEDFDYVFDEDGIPLVDMGKPDGLCYNPITTSQFGLHNLQMFSETGDAGHRDKARACVTWLFEHFKSWRGEIGGWIYEYDLPFYGPQSPWISGMAQGEAISLFLRFHELEANPATRDVTRGAFEAFLHPVADGGVVSAFPDGGLVFEEYPTRPPSQVLNGHMFAMLGIYDYGLFWQDKAASELFELAVKALLKNLHRYDTGFWNHYDLHPSRRLASAMYIRVHLQLLNIMGTLTSEPLFFEIARKWRGYLRNPICRARWLVTKVMEKVRL